MSSVGVVGPLVFLWLLRRIGRKSRPFDLLRVSGDALRLRSEQASGPGDGIDTGGRISYYFDCSRNMKISQAVDTLAALAQETRLSIFRLLVHHAPQGLPAGDIARRLHLAGPTLSFHLNILAAAGLIRPQKNGRSIRYSPALDQVNGLARFLLENCCAATNACVPASTIKKPARKR